MIPNPQATQARHLCDAGFVETGRRNGDFAD